jgi:hypothetical protein
LLLKNRLAFHVLLASAIGAIVSNLGGLFLLGGMEVMGETGGLGFSADLYCRHVARSSPAVAHGCRCSVGTITGGPIF